MKKILIKSGMAAFLVAILFFNVTVVVGTQADSNFKLSGISAAYADTSGSGSGSASGSGSGSASGSGSGSASGSGSGSASGSASGDTSGTNPWGTGSQYYQVNIHHQTGSTIVAKSNDGGITWDVDIVTIVLNGGKAGKSVVDGLKVTVVYTVSTSYDVICCKPGGSGTCNYPPCP